MIGDVDYLGIKSNRTCLPWQAPYVTEEINGELLWTCTASQSFETFKRNTGGACHKLEEMKQK
jgi:hypothetical protein